MATKFEFVVTEDILAQQEVVKAASDATYNNYDYRTKEHKALKKAEEKLETMAKSSALIQAKCYLNENGITTEFEDGFRVYVTAYVSTCRELSVNVTLAQSCFGRYRSGKGINLSESVEDIRAHVEKLHNEWIAANNVEASRADKASKLYEEVKDDVTYKDNDYAFRETGKWTGQTLESEYQSDNWHESASVKANVNDGEIEARLSLNLSFKTVEEAATFWKDAQALFQKYPQLKRRAN